MRPYKRCPKYLEEVEAIELSFPEVTELEQSAAWRQMMAGIEARTGVDMDTEAVKTAWDMCRFEKAWHPFEQTLPGWCSIFSLEDLELLEWREDLKKYYSDGMGYNINTKMTQPLFQVHIMLPEICTMTQLIIIFVSGHIFQD